MSAHQESPGLPLPRLSPCCWLSSSDTPVPDSEGIDAIAKHTSICLSTRLTSRRRNPLSPVIEPSAGETTESGSNSEYLGTPHRRENLRREQPREHPPPGQLAKDSVF